MTMTGRPTFVTKEIFVSAFLDCKDEIILRNGRIATASNPVWMKVNQKLQNKYKVNSLRSLVFKNTHKIKDILTGRESLTSPDQNFENIDEPQNDSRNDISINSSIEEDVLPFDILIPLEEWMLLLISKKYNRTVNGMRGTRNWTVLKPGLWQRFLSEKVWNVIRSRCGFNARNIGLNLDGLSGYINTYCTCGTKLKIEVSLWDKRTIMLHCIVKWGTKAGCRKNYLRQPIRAQEVEKAKGTSVKAYLTAECDKFMEFGDPEPPFIPTASVMYTAKYEEKAANFLDPNPVQAVIIMKNVYPNMIHKVCYDPFFVYYWSNHQDHMFRTYAAEPDAVISTDATGSIVAPFVKPNGEKTGPIFFYEVVIRCSAGQFSVAQLISETHTTLEIANWLREWHLSVGVTPRGIVVDRGRALQNGIIQAFTTFTNVNEYADSWWDSTPNFILRNDVAHLMKNYANLLQNSARHQKIMLMAGFGRLVQSPSVDEMRQILKLLLTIAMSPTAGTLSSGELTECQKAKQKLKSFITVPIDEIVPAKEDGDEDDDGFSRADYLIDEPKTPNRWSELAYQVKKEVENEAVSQIGDEDNITNDVFVSRLIKDMALIPVWGNVCTSRVGTLQRTASSASSESNFNILKNCVFKGDRASSLRVDEALDKHCAFLRGSIKRAKATENQPNDNEVVLVGKKSQDIWETTSGHDKPFSKDTTSSESSRMTGQEHCQIYETQSNPILCIACKNGDYATGAHKCQKCGKNVHLFLACSVPARGSEEGFGQPRVCIECNSKLVTSDVDVAAATVYENWGNKVFLDKQKKGTNKKKALYLGQNTQALKDKLDWQKHPSLPILKNGTDGHLKAIKINGRYWSFTNTCSFDSIYQVILAGAVDDEIFRDLVFHQAVSGNVFHIVMDTIEKTQRSYTYTLRGKILLDLFAPNSLGLVECATDIVTMANKLFADHPSCKEYIKCSNNYCGIQMESVKHVLPLDYTTVNINTFSNILRDCYSDVTPGACYKCNHRMYLETQEFGEIILFDVYSSNGCATAMMLQDIPQTLFNPLINPEKKLSLIGIVKYEGNPVRLDDSALGHYTAIVPRYPEWIEICGLRLKSQDRKNNLMQVNVALLIYGPKKDGERLPQ